MKSFKEKLGETVYSPKSPDEKKFVAKHVVDKKEHPVATKTQFVSNKTKDISKKASYKKGEDESVYEEMAVAQTKKREEIVKSMKKKMSDFKDRYGDRAKDVMYATATKMAMKEEVSLIESVKAGSIKLKDGTNVKLSKEDASALTQLFSELNSANKKKMEQRMTESKKGFDEIINFAKEAM